MAPEFRRESKLMKGRLERKEVVTRQRLWAEGDAEYDELPSSKSCWVGGGGGDYSNSLYGAQPSYCLFYLYYLLSILSSIIYFFIYFLFYYVLWYYLSSCILCICNCYLPISIYLPLLLYYKNILQPLCASIERVWRGGGKWDGMGRWTGKGMVEGDERGLAGGRRCRGLAFTRIEVKDGLLSSRRC